MRYFFFILGCFLVIKITAQQKFAKEFKLVSDNDLYVSTKKDRYYTNGMFISYSFLANDFKRTDKKIFRISLNHKMHTPNKATVQSKLEHDRPFAAHLYGSFGVTNVYPNNHILNASLDLGIMGPSAGGKGIQDLIHNIYGFVDAIGWNYQIQNTFGANLNVDYLVPLRNKEQTGADIYSFSSVRLGTIHNDISAGFYGRIGFTKLASIKNSAAFGTHLNNNNTGHTRSKESFFYYKSTINYVVSNATVEGSLFNNDSPVTSTPNKFRFDLEAGFKFTSIRSVWKYAVTYQTRKVKTMRYNGNVYGSISYAYLFN